LNNPSYIPQRWHGSLIVIAIASLAIIFNTVLARKLPLVEGTVLILHICGFFAILIVMWVLAPRSKASDVFGSFQDNAGWGNVGLSCLVGQLAPIFGLLGSDSATHMSEELRNASWVLPRAMVWSVSINAVLGLIMLISVCFCLGEVPTILASPTGYPYIQVLYNATGSTAATSVLVSIAIIMNSMGCVNNVATSSRQLFAFARDHGLPFGEFLSYVRPGWDIPLNAVLLTFVIAVLMSLINIGSTVAFNSIASLGTGALLSSYIISCSCMFLKRWRNELLLPSRFNLGKYGLAINGISVAYLSIAFVFTFFPAFPHPSADLMNWSILMYGSTATLCLCYFFYKGRHAYVGPVEYLNKDA
jgi:amino acid transporter